MQISQSEIVVVRRARWRVTDVRGYDSCQVVAVAGADPDNSGIVRRFVLPFDDVERFERRSRPVRASRQRWRRACRALIAADTPAGSLRSASAARIDLLPHQLEPALALVRGAGTRVLLADEVGLGKTIQAGLIVAELRIRGVADRVLVVTPSGLRDQWGQELSDRFGIEGSVLDVRALRCLAATLPVGMNPWQAVPVAIASMDYVKRPEVLAAVAACRWDVVVIDEAHNVAGDSDRHAAIAMLAGRSPYVVLASATPHSGDRGAFEALAGIGAAGESLLVFRRSRRSLKFGAHRRIHRLHVRMTADEAAMHALLLRYSRAVRERGAAASPGRDCWLALSVLHKRALSSAHSLRCSVERRLATLACDGPRASQLSLPLDPVGEATREDDVPAWSPLLALDDVAYERRLLGALAATAARAARNETKIAALARLLGRINQPAIVFTEYRDTLGHLRASLRLPCVVLHGAMLRDERRTAIDQFISGGSPLLLATDAAAEGLNLQRTCRLLINLELPWNPMRLEQRIGRVDRIGQRRTVHVFHLIARDSAESRVLARLQGRIALARADIGGADPLRSEPGVTDAPPPRASDGMVMPSYADEATAEAGRVARARGLVRADDRREGKETPRGPLIGRSRHWRTRALLAGRLVTMWQLVAVDGSGRQVGSTVVAVATAASLEPADDSVRAVVLEAALEWKGQTTTVHQTFVRALLARTHAIRGAHQRTEGRLAATFQSGLFDRRLERARLAIIAGDQAIAGQHAGKIASLERADQLSFEAPQLVLVLTR